jgi:hypothetical protein
MAKDKHLDYMQEEEIIAALKDMVLDPGMITKPSFRANTILWPDNKIPFTEAHLAYLKNHPDIDPKHYLSNLRLMIRKKTYC